MIDEPKNKQHKKSPKIIRQTLQGKAILVVGNDPGQLKTLINQLAQKGANVALICWQMQLETIIKLKESVQSADKHFTLIERAKTQTYSSRQLIEAITADIGKLDALIDLSLLKNVATANNKHKTSANWQLSKAAIEQLA